MLLDNLKYICNGTQQGLYYYIFSESARHSLKISFSLPIKTVMQHEVFFIQLQVLKPLV